MIPALLDLYGTLTAATMRQPDRFAMRQTGELPLTTDNDDVDDILRDYRAELHDLTTDAIDGDIDRDDYERELEALALATLLLLFRTGAEASDVPLAAVVEVNEQYQAHRLAVARLSADVYVNEAFAVTEDRPEEDAESKLESRLGLWLVSGAGMYYIGRVYQPAIKLIWQLGDAEHCETCLALAGQVATSDAWRISGYRPRVTNGLLACGGYRCACSLIETDADTTGPITI